MLTTDACASQYRRGKMFDVGVNQNIQQIRYRFRSHLPHVCVEEPKDTVIVVLILLLLRIDISLTEAE